MIAVACLPPVGYRAAGECCSAENMLKDARQLQLFERYLHTIAVRLMDRAELRVMTGFFRARARVGGAAKMMADTRVYVILQRRADADAANSTPSTRKGHKLLSQRPRRLDRLLKVPEEERRVRARDDAVVARQSDHHSFFDAHTGQCFRQVDYLRFRRSYS